MSVLFSRVAVALACFLAPAMALPSETQSDATKNDAEDITVLPRYVVLSEILTITFSRAMGGSLTGAEVTWMAKDSAAEKRGVQVYDQLVSIDGIAIVGENYSDMRDLLERELKPGEAIRLQFSGRRGFGGKRIDSIFTIKRAERRTTARSAR